MFLYFNHSLSHRAQERACGGHSLQRNVASSSLMEMGDDGFRGYKYVSDESHSPIETIESFCTTKTILMYSWQMPFQPFFTNRVFQIFDKDNSGSISLHEFIDAIHQFAGQSPEDKIKFLFKVYDIDGKAPTAFNCDLIKFLLI